MITGLDSIESDLLYRKQEWMDRLIKVAPDELVEACALMLALRDEKIRVLNVVVEDYAHNNHKREKQS